MKSFLLFILVLVSTNLFGQNENLKTKGLTFSFNGLNLSEYYGGIGGKVYLNDDLALNANVGFDSRNRSTAGTSNRTEGKDREKTVVLGLGIEKHFKGMENLEPYWIGRISGSYSERDYDPSAPVEYTPWGEKSITRTISAETGIGVEYWLTRSISFSGQHLFRFYYSTGSTNQYDTNSNQKIINRGFDTGTSSIILAIYF